MTRAANHRRGHPFGPPNSSQPVAGSVSVGAPVGWKRQRPPVGGAAPYLLCSLGALGAQCFTVAVQGITGVGVTTCRTQRYHVSHSAIRARLDDPPACVVRLDHHFAGGFLRAQRFAGVMQAFPERTGGQV